MTRLQRVLVGGVCNLQECLYIPLKVSEHAALVYDQYTLIIGMDETLGF